MNITYQVIEDNAGGLHLFIFDQHGVLIYSHAGYEYNYGQLSQDITYLKNGSDPKTWDGYNGDHDDMVEHYDFLIYSNGCNIVADDKGVYRSHMGVSARKEFGFFKEQPK